MNLQVEVRLGMQSGQGLVAKGLGFSVGFFSVYYLEPHEGPERLAGVRRFTPMLRCWEETLCVYRTKSGGLALVGG